MNTTYAVWKGMSETLEECVATGYANPAQAVKRAETEARKWQRVLDAPTKPRKPERIPEYVAVRKENDGSGHPTLYKLIELRKS